MTSEATPGRGLPQPGQTKVNLEPNPTDRIGVAMARAREVIIGDRPQWHVAPEG